MTIESKLKAQSEELIVKVHKVILEENPNPLVVASMFHCGFLATLQSLSSLPFGDKIAIEMARTMIENLEVITGDRMEIRFKE